VLSEATRQLLPAGSETQSLGEHRLKDFRTPVRLHQIGSAAFPPLRSLAPTNLPAMTSPFVGREADVAEIEGRIASGARLLTITAPGGMGKTRLAIAAARRLQPAFPAGTWWVDLSALREASLVMPTIGAVLGATGDLSAHIGDRSMLIVLDNLEQLVDAAADLDALLAACGGLVLLATSRVRLALPGERELVLASLPLSEAVTLFEDRSGLHETPAVRELCRRLDALPLALELAASRARLLGVDAVLDRLGDRLDVLRGVRGVDERHLTLRTTIAWSDGLLDPVARRLFRRLSIFAGGRSTPRTRCSTPTRTASARSSSTASSGVTAAGSRCSRRSAPTLRRRSPPTPRGRRPRIASPFGHSTSLSGRTDSCAGPPR
jgi:hypothetical protein